VLVFSFFLFLFCSFHVTAPSKNGSANFHDLYVKRRGLEQEKPFGGHIASKNFQGVHFPPKPPKIGPGIRIPSLNKIMNNFSTVHAIFTQISSIGAASQKQLKSFNEITKISF
jgi:hypothetical protein